MSAGAGERWYVRVMLILADMGKFLCNAPGGANVTTPDAAHPAAPSTIEAPGASCPKSLHSGTKFQKLAHPWPHLGRSAADLRRG